MKITKLADLQALDIYPYDPTMLSDAIWCLRGFYWKHERHLQRTDAPVRHSLEFGIGIHKGLQDWFPKRDEIEGIQAFQSYFQPFQEPPKISKKTGKELSATYTLVFGSSLLLAYFQKYDSDTRRIVENEVTLAEELVPGVYLMGIVDKLLEGPRGLIFMDHKSTKYMNDFIITPNLQFMTYKFLTQKLTGTKVTGELDVLGVSKSKSPDELLRREPFDYSHFQMEEWKRSVIYLVHQINDCRSMGYWPQSWNCNPYFKGCPYSPLCTASREEQVEKITSTMYEEKQWDPFVER